MSVFGKGGWGYKRMSMSCIIYDVKRSEDQFREWRCCQLEVPSTGAASHQQADNIGFHLKLYLALFRWKRTWRIDKRENLKQTSLTCSENHHVKRKNDIRGTRVSLLVIKLIHVARIIYITKRKVDILILSNRVTKRRVNTHNSSAYIPLKVFRWGCGAG